MRRGCYPGSFDPVTVAHLAIADAARQRCALDHVDLVLSRVALGKDRHHHPIDERIALIEAAASEAGHSWLRVVVSERQLLVDIAAGYDVVVLGSDKWAQVLDASFYESAAARDDAVRRLPHVACAPRPGHDPPPPSERVTVLDLPPWVGDVSSTAVRAGADHWRAGLPDPQTRRSPE